MKRRHLGKSLGGVIGVLIVAGLIMFGVLSLTHPAKQKVAAAPAPVSAFKFTTGNLPPGWKVNSESSTYINLAGINGCFTTSTLTTLANNQNLSSPAAFNKSFTPGFSASGYVVSNVSTHPLKVNVSGTIKTVNAIYYELTANAATTYHVDSSEIGKQTVAFMSVSCPTATQLENALTTLLSITYNDTYKP